LVIWFWLLLIFLFVPGCTFLSGFVEPLMWREDGGLGTTTPVLAVILGSYSAQRVHISPSLRLFSLVVATFLRLRGLCSLLFAVCCLLEGTH